MPSFVENIQKLIQPYANQKIPRSEVIIIQNLINAKIDEKKIYASLGKLLVDHLKSASLLNFDSFYKTLTEFLKNTYKITDLEINEQIDNQSSLYQVKFARVLSCRINDKLTSYQERLLKIGKIQEDTLPNIQLTIKIIDILENHAPKNNSSFFQITNTKITEDAYKELISLFKYKNQQTQKILYNSRSELFDAFLQIYNNNEFKHSALAKNLTTIVVEQFSLWESDEPFTKLTAAKDFYDTTNQMKSLKNEENETLEFS